MKLTLPIPPSVNCLYAGMQRRFKSGKYKNWIAEAETYPLPGEINPSMWLEVTYTYYTPLYYKNGNVKMIDVANYEKALSDFLGHHLPGFDDKMILKIHLEKIDSERNEVEVVCSYLFPIKTP